MYMEHVIRQLVAYWCDSTLIDLSWGWSRNWNLSESSQLSASVAVTAWPQSPARRDTGRGARRIGFGAGLRRGMAVVLAVAALACWLGKSPVSPGAQSTDGRVAAGPAQAGHSPEMRPVRSEAVTAPSGEAYHARAIETIQTGQRVLARNPELAGGELPDAPVDPATWVNIRLRMPKPTGDFLEITLLRPVEWLAGHLAQTTALDGEYPQTLAEARETGSAARLRGITSVIPAEDSGGPSLGGIAPVTAHSTPKNPWIFLTLHELEAVGPAEIVEVGPCPELEPGEGRLVTGTFSHQSGEVFDITIDGLTEPIGCTGAHPFWSEDRHEFIPARDLRLGETLRTESGTLRQITRITPRRGPPVPVFNLEVDAEHVYYVSVDGVLVHNACPLNASDGVPRAGIDVGEYPPINGHHVHVKTGFGGHGTYDLTQGFGISQDFMRTRGWSHQAMTNKQRELFGELALSGRANSLAEQTRIAEEALVAGGATRAEAQSIVLESLQDLARQGVIEPARIPWQN